MLDLGKLEVMESSTIFLLAENRLLREAITRLLRKKSGISIVGQCGYADSAVQQIAESCCEILLLDNATTDSKPDLIGSFLKAIPELRIILIGVDEKEENFLNAVRSGVVGYILREASAMDVVNAVKAVARREAVFPPQLTLSLFVILQGEPGNCRSFAPGQNSVLHAGSSNCFSTSRKVGPIRTSPAL